MKGRLAIEQQVSEAKDLYPTLITKSQNSYSIIYPDSPQNHFEILIKQDYPDSAPLLYLNNEKIQIPITTYWNPDFSFIQILQHLHLYSKAINGNNILSPPMKNLSSPSIYESKIKPSDKSVKYFGRLISLSNEPNNEIEEEEEPDDMVDEETYQKRLNALNLKLKNKQIHISDYMNEHQTLKKQNGEK